MERCVSILCDNKRTIDKMCLNGKIVDIFTSPTADGGAPACSNAPTITRCPLSDALWRGVLFC